MTFSTVFYLFTGKNPSNPSTIPQQSFNNPKNPSTILQKSQASLHNPSIMTQNDIFNHLLFIYREIIPQILQESSKIDQSKSSLVDFFFWHFHTVTIFFFKNGNAYPWPDQMVEMHPKFRNSGRNPHLLLLLLLLFLVLFGFYFRFPIFHYSSLSRLP